MGLAKQATNTRLILGTRKYAIAFKSVALNTKITDLHSVALNVSKTDEKGLLKCE